MGASIAGLLASVGVAAVMLDIVPPQGLTDAEKALGYTEESPEFRNRFSRGGFDKARNPRAAMLCSADIITNLRYDNTTENLDEIDDADWVIDAVSEKVAVKTECFQADRAAHQAWRDCFLQHLGRQHPQHRGQLAELKRTGKKHGVVSMCIGGDMGAAGVFEIC